MKNTTNTSLANKDQQFDHVYHDRDSLQYTANYPLITFKDDFIKIKERQSKLETYLLRNFWYQKGNNIKRKQMLARIKALNENLEIVINFINKRYAPLGFKCLHISIAGSYLYSDTPGDIDLDVIVNGSFFDYATFNEGIEILDSTGIAKKISLTVMGEDNILGKKKVIDDIENKGFIHQDTIIREMLVAPMRNATIYGKPFDNRNNVDQYNILVRIARQLYFACLTIEGKFRIMKKSRCEQRKP